MKSLAIIPARSGSKGIKNKNIIEICGKPLMSYTLEAAIGSGIFDEVMVSTDSEYYAELAVSVEGVKVPFLRTESNSGDETSTWDVVREVLDNYQRRGKEFDMFCVLQPTSPMRDSRHIREAYGLFVNNNANSIVSVCPLGHSINICNKLPDDNSLVGFLQNPDKYARQMTQTYYRLNGSIYMCDTSAFLRNDSIYNEKSYAYIMSEEDSIDIDNEFDLFVASKLIERKVGLSLENKTTKKANRLVDDVIIFGTSGHAKVLADIVIQSGDKLLGFIDEETDKKKINGFPVIGNDESYINYPNAKFIIGVGNPDIRERLSRLPCNWYTAIHPSAHISTNNVSIGEGTAIMANAVINCGVKVGRHCIINSGGIVDHDDVLSDYSHVSVGSKLGGNVVIGRKTWIGIGASVINNIKICDDCFIGGGAVVVKNIETSGKYVGIPARLI